MSLNLLTTYWAFVEAGAQMDGDVLEPEQVALHYSGNGASCQVTVAQMREAMAEIDRLQQDLIAQQQAANHWFQEANKEHNARVVLEGLVQTASDVVSEGLSTEQSYDYQARAKALITKVQEWFTSH